MASSNATPIGRLRVSLPLTGMLLAPVLAAFSQAYPQIELDIDFSDRLVDIIEEGFDLVLRTGGAVDSRLMTKTVGNYSFTIVASPAVFSPRRYPDEARGFGRSCVPSSP